MVGVGVSVDLWCELDICCVIEWGWLVSTLCYDLEPCARESKYDNQVETRELFYDCLL